MSTSATTEPSVYVLSCDINGFANLEPNQQTSAVEVLVAELDRALLTIKEKMSERVFHTFGGDGFMIAIAPSSNKKYSKLCASDLILPFLDLAAGLHIEIRKKFGQIQSSPGSKTISLRMGLNHGDAIYLPKKANSRTRESELPLGDALNDAQRIMDSGRDWHVLLSDHLVKQIPKTPTERQKTPLTGELFTEYELKLGAHDVLITECPGIFRDKQKKEHVLWRMHSKKLELGKEMPPPKGPRHVSDRLQPNVLADVTNKIEKCDEFFSVTLMPAAIWLTDPTLTAVLIAQAKRIATKGHQRITHHRVFVWDSLSQPGKQRETLECLHNDAAKVQMSILTREEVVSVVRSFQKKIKKANIALDGDSDFIKYPLREFWIASERSLRGLQVKSAGYGVDKNADGSYDDLFPLDKTKAARRVAKYWKDSILAGIKTASKR